MFLMGSSSTFIKNNLGIQAAKLRSSNQGLKQRGKNRFEEAEEEALKSIRRFSLFVLWISSSLLTGLPQCSAPSPALPGISLFGLPRPHSASLTRNSCSSSASFWSCSFCKNPAVDSSSFSRAKMVRSLVLISSTCSEGERSSEET